MPEPLFSQLLPPNSTLVEAAVADSLEVSELRADVLRTLYNPYRVQASLLPWLAWAQDVLIWPRHINETTQRRLIDQSWKLHKMQGTLAAFREAAEIFGGEIVRAITPPSKCFASPSLTTAERNEFVARYPQLRIYRHRTVGKRVGLHCSDVLGRWMFVKSDAELRILPRAYLWRSGQENELTVMERTVISTIQSAKSSTVTEVAIPGTAGRLSFAGGNPRFLTVTEAAKRYYCVTLQQAYQDNSEQLRKISVYPNLTPINVRPDELAETGQSSHEVYAGQFVAKYLVPSSAFDRIYQRLYLFDPEIEVLRRTATLHLNAGRLGIPAHHAEIVLRLNSQRNNLACWRFVRGYLIATDKQNMTDCLSAMRAVMRVSDRVAIKTKTARPVTAGQTLIAGDIRAGDWSDY